MKKILLFVAGLLLAAAPLAASAEDTAELAPGTLVKSPTSSAVYYIDEDLTRHVFPNGRIFESWFESFDGVVEVSDETLAQYPLAGMVPYKPGRLLVKITSDPKVYAVDEGGKLRWVKNERVARALYGENWNQVVQDLSDAFFAEYSLGDDVDGEAEFDAHSNRRIHKLAQTLRVKRMHKLVNRGASSDDLDNRGFGKNKVAVCHNFDNDAHTIYVARPALSAHLRHGDTEGACSGGDSDDDDGDDDDGDDDGDSTSPALVSSSFSGITQTSANLEFVADEDVTAVIYVSTESPVDTGTSATGIDVTVLAVMHDVSLTDLEPGTDYHVVIVMHDESGNGTTTAELTFSTLDEADTVAPSFESLSAGDVAETSATVSFTADEEVTATVYWSTESPVDTGTAASFVLSAAATSHEVDLTGLDASTDYYVVVVASDAAGNETTSEELAFTTLTPDTTAPSLVSSLFADVTDVSASFSFMADEEVTATVYWSDASPVDTGTAASLETTNSGVSHEVDLTGLVAETGYYVVVVMADAAGNEAATEELTFITEATP